MIIMNTVAMNHKMSAVDSSLLAVNRSKLMKLAEGIKTKKKPNHKKTLNFKKDPGYTNIEHLVFGSYRPRTSPSAALSAAGHNVPQSDANTNGCFTGGSACPLDLDVPVQTFSKPEDDERDQIDFSSTEVKHLTNVDGLSNDDSKFAQEKSSLSPCTVSIGVELVADEDGPRNLKSSPTSNFVGESQPSIPQTNKSGNVPVSRPVHRGETSPLNCNLSHGEFNLAFDVDESDCSSAASTNNHYVKAITDFPPQKCGTASSIQISDKQSIPISAPKSPNGIGRVAADRLLDASLHSPPVHMLIKGKYVTHEFSADFSSPEVGSPLDSSVQSKETVASVKSNRSRGSFMYRPECCSSSNSESHLAATKSSPQAIRKCKIPIQNNVPKSSSTVGCSNMKAVNHRDATTIVKERVPPTNCSFRGSVRNTHQKSGPPRSASSCASTGKTGKSTTTTSSFTDVNSSTRNVGSGRREQRVSHSSPIGQRSYTGSNEPLSFTPPTTAVALSPPSKSQDQVNNMLLCVPACGDASQTSTKKVSGKGIISHNALPTSITQQQQQVAHKSLPVRNPSAPQRYASFTAQGCSHSVNVGCKSTKRVTNANEIHSDKGSNNSTSLSASIQTVRKISVSANNPSRPTLATRVKITVSSDGEGESVKNTSQSRSRSGSRSSLVEAQQKSVEGTGSRPSSRASLTGSKSTKNYAVRGCRPRAASGPGSAVGENLGFRGRSSSASSLATGRHFGSSSSSLAGSQNSLCSYGTCKSASCSKVQDTSARHSFHSACHQRNSSYNRDGLMTSKNLQSSCRSSIPGAGGRLLPKTQISGKPPLCPLKTTSSTKPLSTSSSKEKKTATKPAPKSNLRNNNTTVVSNKSAGRSVRNKPTTLTSSCDTALSTSEDCSPTDSSEMSNLGLPFDVCDQSPQNETLKERDDYNDDYDNSIPTIESTLKSLDDIVSLISSFSKEEDQSLMEELSPTEPRVALNNFRTDSTEYQHSHLASPATGVQVASDFLSEAPCKLNGTSGEGLVKNEPVDDSLPTHFSFNSPTSCHHAHAAVITCEDSSPSGCDGHHTAAALRHLTFVSDDDCCKGTATMTTDTDRPTTDFNLSPSKEPCCSTSSSIEETASEPPYSCVSSTKEDEDLVGFVAAGGEGVITDAEKKLPPKNDVSGAATEVVEDVCEEEGRQCQKTLNAEDLNGVRDESNERSDVAHPEGGTVTTKTVEDCSSAVGTMGTATTAELSTYFKNDRPKPSHCERTVSKCARRIKAASSPVFVESRVDAWVSEGDLLHRPWSQICTEKDVERLVQAGESRTLGAGSMATGLESIVQMHPSAPNLCPGLPPPVGSKMLSSTSPTSSQNNLFSRFSSMRTTADRRPPPTPVEGVLQKFRKSFSARFYKKVKGESPPSPSSTSKAGRHASFSSYLDDGCEAAEQLPNGNGSVHTSSVSDVSVDSSCGGGEGDTIFRLGPIVWRSSKERKEKCKKGGKKDEDKGIDKEDDCNNGLSFSVKQDDEVETSSGSVTGKSTPPPTPSIPPPYSQRHCVALSPSVLYRRSHSTTIHPERLKRPLSDQGGSAHGLVLAPEPTLSPRNGVNGDDSVGGRGNLQSQSFNSGSTGHFVRSSSAEASPYLSGPVIRHEKRTPGMRWSRGRSNLRRSVSQPLEMEKMGILGPVSNLPSGGLSDQEDLNHDLSMASSEEEISFDLENGSSSGHSSHRSSRRRMQFVEPVLYAEALWDHVTMDPEELAFKAGDLVEVVDDSDGEWWWGIIGRQAGWFPAPFVRPRVNQEDTVEDCVAKLGNGSFGSPNGRKMSVSLLSNDQVRANVIKEIVSTERDFVRHLKDVCEGYLKQMRKRQDMFPEERINTIFGNIEQLYAFQSEFVSKLVQCIDWEQPHLSQIGACFTDHRQGFEMYSEYCNNHTQAVSELQQLYMVSKYAHFFEACRLLQDMIDISLDGFLLTPIQKICKYPLQLAELLKYTKSDHPDYEHVANALETMRSVAQYINERKRRMECLEKLAAWQMTVEDWEGPDLLDFSSELIYSGDVIKVTAAWSRDFSIFLFDHRLIICKKDLLKRNTYSYKSSLNTDTWEVKDIPDGKDPQFGLNLRNAWKVFCRERGKWIVFATRTAEEKQRWMTAFEDERKRVEDDKLQGFVVTDKAKKAAIMAVQNRRNPKRPKDKENKSLNRRLTRPVVYVPTKSGSLPSNVLLTTNKKKTSSGWFHFGSNKKTKR